MQKVLHMMAAAAIVTPVLMTAGIAAADTTPAATSTATVTIAKYVNGTPATASSTNNASFPMTSVWRADNLSGAATSSGSFSLSKIGVNNPNPYQATTAAMDLGAYYAVSEGTQNSCTAAYPFTLVGYSTGATLAEAASAAISTTSPVFSNLQNDEYVIVWNKTCPPAPTLLSPADGTALTTDEWTSADWSAVTDPVTPITYYFESSASSTTDSTGAFENPAYQSSALSTTSIATTNTPAGTYYWHVRAQDGAGNYSPWSSIFSVTIAPSATSTPTTTPSTTAAVHIAKYLDDAPATASSANSASFPFVSTWRADNLSNGATSTGSYVLSPNGYNGAGPYQANTAAMDLGAYYTTAEVTGNNGDNVLPIGASCEDGKTELVGYSSSPTSFADAASQAISTTAPVFSNLQNDEYVIVWNKTCGTTPPAGTGAIKVVTYSIGGSGTFTFTGDNGIGSFSVTTDGNRFGIFNSGSDAISGLAAGTYDISEATSSDWRMIANSCSHVTVRDNATSTCVVVNFKEHDQPQNGGTISGEVFHDQNDNGRLDNGEGGLAGWTVTLVPGNGGPRQTATTDNQGNYSFTNLQPGWYWLWGQFQYGWLGTSWPNAIYLSAGQSSTGNDFGEREFTFNFPWNNNGLHLGQLKQNGR